MRKPDVEVPAELSPEVGEWLAPVLGAAVPGAAVVFDADGTLWRGDVGEALLAHLIAERALPEHPDPSGLYHEYERRLRADPADAFAFAVAVMAGMDAAELQARCDAFVGAHFPRQIFPFTRPLLRALEAAGCAVWVVSASPIWPVISGAKLLGLRPERAIGVGCELDGGRLTRRVRLPVSCGDGKVAALKARGLRPVLGVGNGEMDLDMLRYSERALVIAPFGEDNGLVRAAKSLGWPVQRG